MMTNTLIKKYVITISIMVVLLTGILAGVFFYNPTVEANTIKITDMDSKDIQAALNKEVEDGKINIQYQLYSVFDGQDSKEFLVRNNPNNHYPIVFKIYDEDNREIYKSNKLMLGYEVNKIHLDKTLGKGEHDCKIEIGYSCKGNVSSRFPLKVTIL